MRSWPGLEEWEGRYRDYGDEGGGAARTMNTARSAAGTLPPRRPGLWIRPRHYMRLTTRVGPARHQRSPSPPCRCWACTALCHPGQQVPRVVPPRSVGAPRGSCSHAGPRKHALQRAQSCPREAPPRARKRFLATGPAPHPRSETRPSPLRPAPARSVGKWRTVRAPILACPAQGSPCSSTRAARPARKTSKAYSALGAPLLGQYRTPRGVAPRRRWRNPSHGTPAPRGPCNSSMRPTSTNNQLSWAASHQEATLCHLTLQGRQSRLRAMHSVRHREAVDCRPSRLRWARDRSRERASCRPSRLRWVRDRSMERAGCRPLRLRWAGHHNRRPPSGGQSRHSEQQLQPQQRPQRKASHSVERCLMRGLQLPHSPARRSRRRQC